MKDQSRSNTRSLNQSIPFYRTVLIFRAIWVVLATISVETLLPLGTPSLLIISAGIIGVVAGSYLAHSRLTSFGLIISALGVFGIYFALDSITQLVLAFSGLTTFAVDRFSLHMSACLLSAGLWTGATWIFWRFRAASVIEVLSIFIGSILLFSGHRNFHLDRPRILNSIAWRLGVDHLTMLVAIGSSLIISALIYLYCASLAVKPRIDGLTLRVASPRRRIVASLLALISIIGLLGVVQSLVYRHYNATMLTRVANGVGMNTNPGVSPLSFQSALGSTNQPAALVRLEGDYANNPFTPMMYMRESALSSFNGKEMVFAGRAYDTDLPVTSTRDTFSRQEDAELGDRTPLIQSIYLLADHDHAFAVDYPISITQLKNPRPNRFKATYRAYSVAPAYNLSAMSSKVVGDSRWTPEIRDHYLKQHPDQRYTDKAREITKDAGTPIEKMRAITNHLSRTAIYTLTPNHEVKPNDDPVAAFLFGDNRGYCVHFAHAIVYMARGLGIPARIGTGYLTDLSQAKDGHILLRMSDRHAWAEIFVDAIGWIPFDVQPDQVESHAETQVDAKLLEELMGVLEPGEEILPKDSAEEEPGMLEPERYWIPSQTQITLALGVALALMVLAKLLLRCAWRIAPSPRHALRWGYIAAASTLHDIGITRAYGETRSEFADRSPNMMLNQISSLLLNSNYSSNSVITRQHVRLAMLDASLKFAALPRKKRILAAINPGSIVRALNSLITGGSW